MKERIVDALVMLLAAAALVTQAEAPKMPEPQAEHAWLMQLVGEWQAEVEMIKEHGQPPEKTQGTESVRGIGDFWVLGENKGSYMDKPFTGILTLGYDPTAKQFVGTWIDSMTSHLWTYRGKLNEARTALTLEAKGPCPMAPGKMTTFKETIEFKSKDHRVFSSFMQADDGTWAPMMTINYRRTPEEAHQQR